MSGRRGRGRKSPAKAARPRSARRTDGGRDAKGASRARTASDEAAPTEPAVSGPFRLGAIPGATPGTWIDRWNERVPDQPLVLVPLAVADQRAALTDGEVDAALVRLPLDREGLHVIPLYDEVTVVVSDAESHLTAADELSTADLEGEIRIVPGDDVLGFATPGTIPPVFAAPATTEEAIATAATGTGIVIVPMSLARLHHRKDAAHRVLADAPSSTVALAWIADRTTPAVETFVGIVRGRTARSSRG